MNSSPETSLHYYHWPLPARQVGDLPAAEQYLKLALHKNPQSISVYLALIEFYESAGRAAEVEPLFAQALAVSENDLGILQAQVSYYVALKKVCGCRTGCEENPIAFQQRSKPLGRADRFLHPNQRLGQR